MSLATSSGLTASRRAYSGRVPVTAASLRTRQSVTGTVAWARGPTAGLRGPGRELASARSPRRRDRRRAKRAAFEVVEKVLTAPHWQQACPTRTSRRSSCSSFWIGGKGRERPPRWWALKPLVSRLRRPWPPPPPRRRRRRPGETQRVAAEFALIPEVQRLGHEVDLRVQQIGDRLAAVKPQP